MPTQLAVRASALQQPPWSDPDGLHAALRELSRRPPLVDAASCHALQADLSRAAGGEVFVIQGGDCAELFSECGPDRVRAKARQLHRLARIFEAESGRPTVRIGRLAGQFAKPRSSPWEEQPDGTFLPAYRGDAVNSAEPSADARRADPRRLLLAYEHSARALETLLWSPSPLSTYTSHEALLLDYERALLRPDGQRGGQYASSAHFLWIGERTRQLDHQHVALARTINNPIGVKIGPAAEPEDVAALVALLNPDREPGRLTLITRLGAAAIAERLPALLDMVGPAADQLVWMCDPLHGNTTRAGGGQKCRVMTQIVDEVTQFFRTLRRHGVAPGGLHLEMTPRAVTECVENDEELGNRQPLPVYETACDPRLNAAQAERVVRLAAEEL